MIQRSEAWYAARLGIPTASRIADATARVKKGWGASRDAYMAELVLERLNGQRAEQPWQNRRDIQWGVENEPKALIAYALARNVEVVPCGFIQHPHLASGASPDGLVGEDGTVEVKCPASHTHMATLDGAPIDGGYVKQVQWQMACTGRSWCDWVSYDPRFAGRNDLEIRRVRRDDKLIRQLTDDIIEFLAELDGMEQRLRARAEGRSVLRQQLEASVAATQA